MLLPREKGFGANKTPQKKLLNIILPGGWDTALATDPVTNSKLASGNYESVYRNNYGIFSAAAKSNLLVGEGLVDEFQLLKDFPLVLSTASLWK